MNKSPFSFKVMAALAAVSLAGVAGAEMMDRPVGIRIGQRMTLKPYVAVSAIYDTNVDNRNGGDEDVVWLVNPGLSLQYKAENWLLEVNAFYQYNAYSKSHHQSSSTYSYHGYGEDALYRWTDSTPGEAGWSLMLAEKYKKINQVEDMTTSTGNGYNRDREEVKFASAVERRFSSGFHADANASYYWLDYDNANRGTSGTYGWDRWQVGLEGGYAFSKWTDLLIAGSYQGYKQDNTSGYSSRLSDESKGWTLQGGFGSYATEKIAYRILAGWSCFEYADEDNINGFTYTASGRWKITDYWDTMIMATSYYQPSETEYGSATRVDSVSWGLSHIMVHGKLSANFDIAYRRQTKEYSYTGDYDYDLDIYTCRLGLNYTLNRYLGLFSNIEYRESIASGGSRYGDYYDYDRFRFTIGMRFTY